MSNVRVFAGKDQLIEVSLLAIEREWNGGSFTDGEVVAAFGAIEKCFGMEYAKQVIEEVQQEQARQDVKRTFNETCVEVLAYIVKQGIIRKKFEELV